MARTSTKLKNRARETVDEISDTAERSYNGAKRMGRKAAHRAEEAWEGGSNTIEDMASEAGRKLNHLYHDGSAKAQETAEYARDAVQTRPLTALAGAFVAGLVASAFLRR